MASTLERIREQRAAIDPAKVAQTALLALPYAIAWMVRKVIKGAWWGLSFLWAAGAAGWRAGR